jgi:acyl-CoA thioester hydrolase
MTITTQDTLLPYGDVVPMPVHFDDLDAMGMLHNSRYAVLVERAVVLWWTERGVSFSGGRPSTPDAFSVVREYSIAFHRPVVGTGEIGVHFWLERMGTTSADYRFRVISPDGGRLHVRLDPVTMRPTPWTEQGRATAAVLLRG